MSSIESGVAAALQPFSGRHCAIGLSGGLDSVVLLDLLARVAPCLSLRLTAIHVNHQISPNADYWQEFCSSLAQSYGIPFCARRVTLRRPGGESLEALARDARYEVYQQSNADLIVLAHHLDDQCETLLLRLLRGAGTQGLAAMPGCRTLGQSGKLLLRPLLHVSRAELEDYAKAAGLRSIHDESNDDRRFRRNWLRHELLPRIAQIYPEYRQQFRQATEHLRESAELLDEMAQTDFSGDLLQRWLHLPSLALLSLARQRNVLRWFVRQYSQSPATRELEQLQQQMLLARIDAEPSLILGDWIAERYRERMYMRRNRPEPACPDVNELRLIDYASLQLPEWGGRLTLHPVIGHGIATSWLRTARLQIRRRSGGERLRPTTGSANRQVKHLLQEAGIPPWNRRNLPLIWFGEQLVAIPGVAVAAEFQARAEEPGVEIYWQPDLDQVAAMQ